ncbi:hypothetical protein ACHAXR_007222 [Thalassiosira sp. AJA248-18]
MASKSENKEGSAEEDGSATNNATSSIQLPYHIGGPHTSLPFVVESFLGWSLCLSCLAVSGYHYGKSILLSSGLYYNVYRRARGLVRLMMGGWVRSLLGRPSNYTPSTQLQSHSDPSDEATWIPLTTHSRAELEKQSPWERYLSLVQVLEKCHPDVLTPLMGGGYNKRVLDETSSQIDMDDMLSIKCNADAALIRVLRKDSTCRRLASLAMRPYDATKFTATSAANKKSSQATPTTLLKQFPHNRLLQRLSKFWNHFLVLPSLQEAKLYYRIPTSSAIPVASAKSSAHANAVNYPYRISLVLPAYREKGSHLLSKLTTALESTRDPNEVEVIVVDAGGCSDLDMLLSLTGDEECGNDQDGNSTQCWGQVVIFSFLTGGGRGPCLNFGASVSNGRILTFCHSDTTLPRHWDESIVAALEHDGVSDDELSRQGIARANSCAFSFGIDTSEEGLSMQFESSTTSYYPPGIRAVETTANLRTHLYKLPYGDQVISLHTCIFDFLGGFPDQCLMEDYELVSLLRRRAALFANPSVGAFGKNKEKLAIIGGAPALCSPRRWQKFGVLYVTYNNSKFVNLYAGTRQMGPDELFQLYYGREPPRRDTHDSPWEIELVKMLQS